MEKLLKAFVVKTTGQSPPRTHNLVNLRTLARLVLQSEQEQFLSKLSVAYVEARYPSELDSLAALNNRNVAEEYLQHTEALFQWLEAQMKPS